MVTKICVHCHRVPNKQRAKMPAKTRASLPRAKKAVPTRKLEVKQRRSHGPRSR